MLPYWLKNLGIPLNTQEYQILNTKKYRISGNFGDDLIFPFLTTSFKFQNIEYAEIIMYHFLNDTFKIAKNDRI